MKIPGFSAEAAVQVRGRQPWSGGLVAGSAAAVIPAAPCCSACFDYCAENPKAPFCRYCKAFCSPRC
jgi:hypothetical protein